MSLHIIMASYMNIVSMKKAGKDESPSHLSLLPTRCHLSRIELNTLIITYIILLLFRALQQFDKITTSGSAPCSSCKL
jgi:predicted secreted protein